MAAGTFFVRQRLRTAAHTSTTLQATLELSKVNYRSTNADRWKTVPQTRFGSNIKRAVKAPRSGHVPLQGGHMQGQQNERPHAIAAMKGAAACARRSIADWQQLSITTLNVCDWFGIHKSRLKIIF